MVSTDHANTKTDTTTAKWWVAAHGDPDLSGLVFWCGYVSEKKDHTWDRDVTKAVRFYDLTDVDRAGLGVKPNGIKPCLVVDGKVAEVYDATGKQS